MLNAFRIGIYIYILVYSSLEMKEGFHEIELLAGDTIKLPCNVSTFKNDQAVLILWYRDNEETPIYSVDIRVGSSNAAKHWSKKSGFGKRAQFVSDNGPGELLIRNAIDEDGGVYRCRVDFLKAQTRNIKINLSVITPPDRICIKDDGNNEKSTVSGPYNEHDSIYLKCEVYGGKPPPKISWYHEDKLIDSETKIFRESAMVYSEITFGPLNRNFLNTKLICKANNHPLVMTLESMVQIDMNFPPLYIRLLGANKALSAGRRYDILCQSSGSRPPAILTWWYDGIRLQKAIETVSSDGNESTSTLSIALNKTHTGKYLSCRAYNYAVSMEPLEDGTKLDIQYIPEVSISLGATLDPNWIREGQDVYFDCKVIAYPSANKIEWQRNGKVLTHNVAVGIIISNLSLVLQSVTRETAGNYSCAAYNTEGKGISPPSFLNVLYIPTCVYNQPRIYGIAKRENVAIKCTVDANPPDVEFFWTFNNSLETVALQSNHAIQSGTTSLVTFSPMNELDYGSLLCVASNKIGRQNIPCVFHIISAGKPDEVQNCSLSELTTSTLTVTCANGFDGGLPQSFYLEVKDVNQNEIKINMTSNVPIFVVKALTPGAFYLISVYAFNSKGRSEAANLNIAMLKIPDGQLISETNEDSQSMFLLSSAMSLTVGLIFSAIMVAITITWASLISWRAPESDFGKIYKKKEEFVGKSSPVSSMMSFDSAEINDAEYDKKSPDIIPGNIDLELQVGDEIELGTALSFYSFGDRTNWPITKKITF